MPAIDRSEFARFCIEQAARFYVNAHYLIAAAQLHSGVSDDTIDGHVGPFGFTLEQWNKALERVAVDAERFINAAGLWNAATGLWAAGRQLNVSEIEPVHASPSDIASWRVQCQVFAAITARIQRKLMRMHRRQPEAAEIYCSQMEIAVDDREDAARRFGEALDSTGGLLADVTFDLPGPFVAELSARVPKGEELIPMSTSTPRDDAGYVTPLPQDVKSGQYRVWYGTNRRPVDPSDMSKGYSAEPDTDIHYGHCTVFVPASHVIGSLGSPWWCLLRGVDDRLRLLDVRSRGECEFWDAISQQWAELDRWDRHAVVFVHGYNVSFEAAALRAAQIGYDLSVNGAMAFFSWPSQGRTADYTVDEDAIEQSEQPIANFMTDFAKWSGADVVHIIAHSMGNRGVLRAVNRIAESAEQQSGSAFGQIILAAADVNQSTFRSLCGAYSRVAKRTTLYVSKGDLALGASVWLHKFARVGILPPVFVTQGIDTVNVTSVDLSFLGHGYIAQARGVLQDMYQLIVSGTPPERRFGLRSDTTETGERFWSLRK